MIPAEMQKTLIVSVHSVRFLQPYQAEIPIGVMAKAEYVSQTLSGASLVAEYCRILLSVPVNRFRMLLGHRRSL